MIRAFILLKTYCDNAIKSFKRKYLRGMRFIKEKRTLEPQPCIRCSKCVPVCPAQLLPQQLWWHIQGNEIEKAHKIGLLNCIECRLCEQVCPSDIPLVSAYQFAKTELNARNQEKIAAKNARKRFIEKQERLEKIKISTEEQKENKIRDSLQRIKEIKKNIEIY